MKKNIYHLALIVSFILFSSCSKEFTETQFFQEDRADEGISSVEQLSSLLRGAYVSMRDATTWDVITELMPKYVRMKCITSSTHLP